MPKVTDKYMADKRDFILECTGEILKEKPLYLVTMRDIIKKAGFSHGIIYHYYANLDEIYVDYINQNTTCYSLEQIIETLISSEQTEKEILSQCIVAIGEYLGELFKTHVGRVCFELTVLYAYDFEKRASVYSKLKFKQCLAFAEGKIVEYVMRNVEKGVLIPQIPVRAIVMFVSSFIDGIAQSFATSASEGRGEPTDIAMMFQTLARAVVGFLEVQYEKSR